MIHFFDNTNDVFTDAFFDLDTDGPSTVESGAPGLILESVLHPRHILEVDRTSFVSADDQAVYLVRGLKFPGDPQLKSAIAHADAAAGYVEVFIGNDGLEFQNGEPVIGQLSGKGLYSNLPLQSSGDIGLQDAGDGFNVFFEVFRDLLESDHADVSGQSQGEDGHLREVDFSHLRVVLQVGRKLPFCQIDLVLGLAQDLVDIRTCHKFDHNGTHPFSAG